MVNYFFQGRQVTITGLISTTTSIQTSTCFCILPHALTFPRWKNNVCSLTSNFSKLPFELMRDYWTDTNFYTTHKWHQRPSHFSKCKKYLMMGICFWSKLVSQNHCYMTVLQIIKSCSLYSSFNFTLVLMGCDLWTLFTNFTKSFQIHTNLNPMPQTSTRTSYYVL